jgi:peptidoglycan hydrolase-like protein with peptidoglycan-binding domain
MTRITLAVLALLLSAFAVPADARTTSEVLSIQNQLDARGYFAGRKDGVMGPMTMAALSRFQRDSGLFVDGLPNSETVTALFGGSYFTEPQYVYSAYDYKNRYVVNPYYAATTVAYTATAPLAYAQPIAYTQPVSYAPIAQTIAYVQPANYVYYPWTSDTQSYYHNVGYALPPVQTMYTGRYSSLRY